MSECKRKKGESFEQFFRRVKQSWRLSGKILEVKKMGVYTPSKSRNVRKKNTVAFLKKRSKMQYLQKTGKLPKEEDPYRRKK